MSKYTFEFNNDLESVLTELAASKKTTKADILRRAVASYAYLNKETNNEDKKVSITNNEDRVVKDVILP